jgi:hypothetical protein
VVIDKLAEGTGGQIFSIDHPSEAAKAICDELRKNRYVLSYVPSSAPYGQARSLLVLGNQGITVRSKSMQTAPVGILLLPSRVQPKQDRHNYQHQRLHEDEEAENKLAVLVE